jgi:hypothetical protein
MAFLYPDVLPLDIQVDSRRSAERMIYNAAKQLDDSYFVFYSRTWRRSLSWGKSQAGAVVGECDFVFLSSTYGILCVEVKGGAISHGQSGFFSTDKQGKIHAIQNPYAQALRSKYHFLRVFRSIGIPEFAGKNGNDYILYAAFFPESLDTGWMKDDLSFSSEISGFALDISDLNQWLCSVFGGTLTIRGLNNLDSSAIAKIRDVMSPASICRFTLAPLVRETEVFFNQRLIPTSEQWYLIDQLRYRKKELIIGPAGTGKTLVVLEYLKRNVEDKGKALFLCMSSFLAHDIRRLHKDLVDIFQIKSLTELIDDIILLCDEHGIDYDDHSLTEIIDMVALKTSLRYEVLVIDEIQDVSPALHRSLSRLVSNSGQLICCYDPEQNPFDCDYPNRTAEEMGFTSVDTLTHNIRNTPEIMEHFLSRCPSKSVWRTLAPSGAPVSEITVAENGYSSLVRIVNTIIEELDASPGMIAVLLRDYDCLVSTRSFVKNAITSGVVGAEWGALRLSTVIDFKGLESNVVLVWDSKSLSETEYYIACSRARSSLYLINIQPSRLQGS